MATKKQPRDTQRRKVYAAEHEWVKTLRARGQRRQFVDFAHIQAYAETVFRWVRDNPERLGINPLKTYIVKPRMQKRRRGNTSTSFEDGLVLVASTAKVRAYHWTDHMVLHELSHLWIDNGIPHHGWQWAALYIKLVERWMGKEAAAALRLCFRQFRVKHHPPRVLSPERREQLAERMRLMRLGLTADDIAMQERSNREAGAAGVVGSPNAD